MNQQPTSGGNDLAVLIELDLLDAGQLQLIVDEASKLEYQPWEYLLKIGFINAAELAVILPALRRSEGINSIKQRLLSVSSENSYAAYREATFRKRGLEKIGSTEVPIRAVRPTWKDGEQPHEDSTEVDVSMFDRDSVQKIPPEVSKAKPEALLGKRLGKFEINEVIGRGSLAWAFLATHTKLNAPVALKILKPWYALIYAEIVNRFKREALISMKLQHENVIRVFDYDEHDNYCYIVMEHLNGATLASRVREKKPLVEDVVLEIARDLSTALRYIHIQGIVHRDVKPSNVISTENRMMKLMDFGLARAPELRGDVFETQPATWLGSPAYCAPEQIKDATSVDYRADFYSLGITLYELATGNLPFRSDSLAELIGMHESEEAIPANVANKRLRKGTSELIARLMAKRPSDRFQTHADLLKRIDAMLEPFESMQ